VEIFIWLPVSVLPDRPVGPFYRVAGEHAPLGNAATGFGQACLAGQIQATPSHVVKTMTASAGMSVPTTRPFMKYARCYCATMRAAPFTLPLTKSVGSLSVSAAKTGPSIAQTRAFDYPAVDWAVD